MATADIALGNFRKNGLHLNCAQTVLYSLKEHSQLTETQFSARMEEYSEYGHGGHESGHCGAYYAANQVLSETQPEHTAAAFRETFAKITGGHVECDDIREVDRLSCEGCVKHAARFVDSL